MADYREENKRVCAAWAAAQKFTGKCGDFKPGYGKGDGNMLTSSEFAKVRDESLKLSRVLADLTQPIK